jgi:Flp pilus assembly protein TadG
MGNMGVNRRRRYGVRGQAAVEFILSLVFVFIVIVGALEMIMLVYTYTVLADAAKEGVRYAIVHGFNNGSASGPTCPCAAIDGAAGTGVVKTYAQLSLHDTSAMTVTVSYPDGTNTPPSRVRVQVVYPYQAFFGLGWPTVTVNAMAEGRIAY